MTERLYRCQSCGRLDRLHQPLSDPLEPACWFCGTACPRFSVVPQLPYLLMLDVANPARYVGGQRPLRREYVLFEDGREVVFKSLEQARRHEMERHGNRRLARKNLTHLRKLGYLPGTVAALRAAANDEAAL